MLQELIIKIMEGGRVKRSKCVRDLISSIRNRRLLLDSEKVSNFQRLPVENI